MDDNLSLYSFLARQPRPKSYIGKIMLVAFLGTHVPLLALLGYFVVWHTALSFTATLNILAIALVATLVGTALTLYALHKLLAPIKLVYMRLRRYLNDNTLPNLPTEFTDEAGVLMADTQYAVKRLDDAFKRATFYDELTGLPNRASFNDRLRQALSDSSRSGQSVAVLLLDIDNFKNLNDRWGTATGDGLLKAVAQRLSNALREMDVLARPGSDQFMILRSNLHSADEAGVLARRLLDVVAQPHRISGHEIHTSACLGISLGPEDSSEVAELLRNSETAMCHARQQGRDAHQFYSAESNKRLQRRLELESELHGALERSELMLHYQPLVDTSTKSITGVEALLRWDNPSLGLVSPAEFIPVAEESGLIVPIGEWVLRAACREMRCWQQAGMPSLRIAVNLSARQFQQSNLVETVAAVLQETGLNATHLELEITESTAMKDAHQATLQRLHDMGVTISLDDFGIGYSSLSYLKRFPINTLKIDQSFVRDIDVDSHDTAIVDAVIALAHSLQLKVIAEGVETKEQLAYLEARDCDALQGYLFSRPVTAAALVKLLAAEETSTIAKAPDQVVPLNSL